MISGEDAQWLSAAYPGLVSTTDGVTGTIQFAATFNKSINRFLILGDGVVDDVGGIKLACTYRIRIVERDVVVYSALPALHVGDLDTNEDRHFNRSDKSACLCSPIEEKEFLQPTFDFKRYLEQLVIPFLYGQSFYSEYHRWPWAEYAHGATGLLESYSDGNITDRDGIQSFIFALARDPAWPHIRAALQRTAIKGHTPCFCTRRDHIRRCHPKALSGLRQLQKQLAEQSIQVP